MSKTIAIRGAGICGLWHAFLLARCGHTVSVLERSTEAFEDACSRVAGAMLSPYCEDEASEPLERALGLRGLALWEEHFPDASINGCLVVAQPRDRRELDRFARATESFERLDGPAIEAKEPDLADRFEAGLFYAREGHVSPHDALPFMMRLAEDAGATIILGADAPPTGADIVIDCRGLAARDTLKHLRGVRGERVVVQTSDVNLSRPIRLLHPRFPIYVVPWGDGLFLIGATQIESDEEGPVTLRSALELLSTAYALHPAFGEAQIVEFATGVRPAFPDNQPRIVVENDHIYVNGLFRHGYLLAPALAEVTARYIETGERHPEVFA